MQAVILAAGLGKRLRPLTEQLPKGLIEIEGKSLLEYTLNTLKDNGIKKVTVVVGFLSQQIQRKIGQDYAGLDIEYILNNRYLETGSMYSLSQIKDRIRDEDIILLESDLLYEPKAIEAILNTNFRDCLLVANLSNSSDEVYICADTNYRITELGKNISLENKRKAIGELVGISKLSWAFLDKLFSKAEDDYKNNRLDYHYEECIFAVNKLGNPVYALLIPDLLWVEIDKENDLKKAREEIYPQIKKYLNV